MENKETPKETYNRVLIENGYDPELSIEKEFDVCKRYYHERIKIELPTEEEIDEIYPERTDSGSRLDCNICRREGAKQMRDLLIK